MIKKLLISQYRRHVANKAKPTSEKPMVNITLNGKKLEAFQTKNKRRMPILSSSNTVLAALVRAIRPRKRNKQHPNWEANN